MKLAVLAAAAAAAHAADLSAWKNRTIYQVLTDRFAADTGNGFPANTPCTQAESPYGNYCGGTWNGITKRLDYILDGIGADAVWISPMVTNTPGGYHGYWALDLYTPNPYFGSGGDLQALSSALHSRSAYLMLDVVVNHMGINGGNYGAYVPFNNPGYFHDCSICPSNCNVDDYTDLTQMEHCRLAGLPDLNQTDPSVWSTTLEWLNTTLTNYSIDGVRLDTTPYVHKEFLSALQETAGMYVVGEVDNGDPVFVSQFQGPLDATLNYPMFFTLRNVFASQQSMNNIQNTLQQSASLFSDLDALALFTDNHDNPRFLNERNDHVAYMNALLYTLMGQGIPIIYQGSEQGYDGGNDPACREPMWPSGYNLNGDLAVFISKGVALRKKLAVWSFPQVQRYSDDTFYAFTRGTTFVALTNVGNGGASQSRSITYHPYSNGQKLCNALLSNPSSDCVTVSNGAFQVNLVNGQPKVYTPA